MSSPQNYLKMYDYDYWQTTKLEQALEDIEEATKNLDKNGVYQQVLRFAIENERVDVLNHIYDDCSKHNMLRKQIEKHFYYSITHGRFKVAEFLIDKKVPLNDIDSSIKVAIPLMPTSLLKKFHEKTYDLTKSDLKILVHMFHQYPANFESIDYLLSLGLKIEDDYKEIVKGIFMVNSYENMDKINYLYEKGIDLNRDDNILLMFAIQSKMPEMLEHLLSKNIEKVISDEYVHYAFYNALRMNNPDFLDEITKKEIKFNINTEDFIRAIAEHDATEIFKYCVPLGLDVEKIKTYADNNLKELLVKDLYNNIDNNLKRKDNVSNKKAKL